MYGAAQSRFLKIQLTPNSEEDIGSSNVLEDFHSCETVDVKLMQGDLQDGVKRDACLFWEHN